MASTPTGNGYWCVARDGGVFSFGDARFYGSLAADGSAIGRRTLDAAARPQGDGYWMTTT
ncbi:MAG: hypothetical protein KatS3mg010_1645 [Acidimicrobiia bacterium]|nr:MAG: hypothetical protein KatS3mg010_1645 [Acidimicrobiia bacterium]